MNDVEMDDFSNEYLKEKKPDDENKEKEKKVIKGEEFEKIKTGIMFILQENEKNGKVSLKNKVVGEFLEKKIEDIQGEEQLNELTSNVVNVLNKLIADGILYENKNEEEPDNPKININVNYDIPDIFDA